MGDNGVGITVAYIDEISSGTVPVIVCPGDSLKMIRETLCAAQAALSQSEYGDRCARDRDRSQRLINDIDRQRPLGPDGKHGQRHTPTCGCEDQ